ncbi:hypothetical protein PIB30_105785, partial [Stylosanthes scabra]|nr:hypothetical protein [Stylosanthes scabra]
RCADGIIRRCIPDENIAEFYGIVTLQIMVDTLAEIEQRLKCSNVVFIGPRSLKMLVTLSRDVTNAKGLETSQGNKRCLRPIYLNLKYLMFGA